MVTMAPLTRLSLKGTNESLQKPLVRLVVCSKMQESSRGIGKFRRLATRGRAGTVPRPVLAGERFRLWWWGQGLFVVASRKNMFWVGTMGITTWFQALQLNSSKLVAVVHGPVTRLVVACTNQGTELVG